MDLRGIIAIAGKPGLYKVAAQGRNNIIVQSLESNKKFPAFASDKISTLEDISIYTYETDVPLSEVYQKIAEKESYGKAIGHNESQDQLRAYLSDILPDYHEERVYDNDVKKIFQWYNILVDHGFIKEGGSSEEQEESAEKLDKAMKAKANTANKVAAEQMKSTAPEKSKEDKKED